MPGPDPDGQVSLMLRETLHSLAEEGVIFEGASIWAKIAHRYVAERPGASDVFRGPALRHHGFRARRCRDDLLSGGLLATSARRSMWVPMREVPKNEQFNR
jgi:hypothetical protein